MKQTHKTSYNRIMIAALKSGSGKTLFTCGLLVLLKDRFKNVLSYKCGPDYIDPMFHRTVLGIEGTNLDPFFSDGEELRKIIADNAADISVLEGAMGIYDGITGLGKKGSCYEVARETKTPIILLADAKGFGATIIPVIRGILEEDEDHLIKGIVFNRMSAGYLELLRPEMEKLLASFSQGPKLLGAIPTQKDIGLESRHLGLVMPDEIAGIKEQLASFAAVINENIDIEKIIGLAESAEEKGTKTGDVSQKNRPPDSQNRPPDSHKPVLAVARDEAFCFYYEQNIKLLSELGAEVRYFSPLKDKWLPAGSAGLLLGGGYPELYAKELSANSDMKKAIKTAIEGGMPSLAECGGFMYLGEYIEDEAGAKQPMAGVFKGGFSNTGKLTRFGYVTVSPEKDGLLSNDIKGHEFHYYDGENCGNDCTATKPSGSRSWPCMHMGKDHIWGFPHLYYPSQPQLAEDFIKAMREYNGRLEK